MADGATDCVTAAAISRLAATLDYATPPWPPGLVPPLGHWLFTLPDATQSALGADGHPAVGMITPPSGRPRRMWAGSRIRFGRDLRVDDVIMRRSAVIATEEKPAMTLVTVRHEVSVAGEVAVVEEQDLVYLPARKGPDRAPARTIAVPPAVAVRTMTADPALLFRFSALTFNAHRIHYDRDYATDVEHYPGLVVHGPLLAMLLLDHARRVDPAARIASFAFRARAPVFAGEAFDLCLAGAAAWVRVGPTVAMTAEIGLA